jgi:hypothetical protein
LVEDHPEDAGLKRGPVEAPRAAHRGLLVVWEVFALGGLVLARLNAPGSCFHADLIALAWLLGGLHLWRGLAVLQLTKAPPIWLLPLEAIALMGWLDAAPWADPSAVKVPILARLISWRGILSVGTQPLWSLIPALAAFGFCLRSALRSSWLAARRPLLVRWVPRAAGLTCLVVFASWFLGSSSQGWERPSPQVGLERSRAFSWRTGVNHEVLRGRFSGVWACAEGIRPGEDLLLRYRSEGLLEPEAVFVAVKGASARVIDRRRLYQTSPNVVRLVLPTPPALEAGEELRLELRAANDPRFSATLEVADLGHCRTSFATRAEREGWVPAALSSPFTPFLLALLVLYLYATWPSRSGWSRWVGVVVCLMAWGSWLSLTIPALRILFGWLALVPATLLMGLQGWLSMLPLAEAVPPLVTFGASLQEVMTGQLGPLFYGRPLSAGASPEYLERLEAKLQILGALPTWLLAAGLLGLAVALPLSARPPDSRPAGKRASTYLFLLGAASYVLYPSWHLPIAPESQRLVALLLVGGLLLLWRGLRALEDRIPAARLESPRRAAWLDPAALTLVGLYLLLRIPDLFLPPTFNSDEGGFRSAASLLYTNQRRGLGLSLEVGLQHRAAVLALAGVVGLALFAAAKRVREFDRWLIGVSSAGLLAWALWIPIPDWDVMTTFRYPPLAKLIPGLLAWINGDSLPASRFWCLAAYTGAGYALFLAARRLGLARAAAFGALIFFLGLNMTWYWSVFAYNTAFLVLFTALAAVPLLGWLRDAEPAGLAWTGLWLAAASASRVTGVVSFAILFLAVLTTLLTSPRHRTRGNAWGVAFLLCAILPGALLWHKLLVGGWYGWVGRYLEWQHFKAILGSYDRWRLTGYSILNMNGGWAFALIVLGGLSAFAVRQKVLRLGAWLLGGWLVLATTAPIILGRGQVWDGLPRFIVPALLPAALLVGLACDAAQRRAGRWAPLALVLPILLFGRHPVVDQPAALPTDLNVYVQHSGRSHGFLPEDEIVTLLPAGVGYHEVAVVHEAGIVGQHLRQVDPTKIQDLESIDAEMERRGFRVFVFPYAPDPVVNDSLWRFQRVKATIDPALWQDPARIDASPLFRRVDVFTFHGVEYRIYERTSGSR